MLSKEDRDIATSYNDIGLVYSKRGEYDTALNFYEKALAIQENVLGKEHPDTATSYSNIGLMHSKRGEYDTASQFYEKALVIRKDVLGNKHPNTIISYRNIAVNHFKCNKYKQSLDYYVKAYPFIKLEYEQIEHNVSTFISISESVSNDLIKIIEANPRKYKYSDPLKKIAIAIIKIVNVQKIEKEKEKEGIKISHYTSWSNAKSILLHTNKDNKKTTSKINLRLYHSEYANDPDEGKWILDILETSMENEFENDIYPFYVSFVDIQNEDPDNLQFWQTYGDKARGVALITDSNNINIDTTDPMETVTKDNDKHNSKDSNHSILCRVKYLNKNSLDEKDSTTNDSSGVFENLKAIKKALKEIEIRNENHKKIANRLIFRFLGHLFKSKSYEHEKEVRLLRYVNSGDNTIKCDDEDIPKLYVESDIKNIDEILIGPANDKKPFLYLTHIIPKKNQLFPFKKTKISSSTIRYRNTK